MKHLFSIALLLLLPLMPFHASAQRVKCEPFRPEAVRLTPSRFYDNFRRDSAWIMSIRVDRLLHSFRTTAGVFSSKEGGYMTMPKLGGWESLDCDIRGHTTGHLLSALAWLYAQTGSKAVKAKADSLVDGLNAVQHQYGTGYLSAFGEGLVDRNIVGKSVWVPFYTLHKIVAGLLDQYDLCHNDTALAEASLMAGWAYRKLHGVTEAQRLRMIRNEFGGFNEAMYRLYSITKDEKALWLAHFFYDKLRIDPLKASNTDLGTNHANTFIPKLLGECRNYELFGNESSRRASELFFTTLTTKHAFVTGEVSDKEHLFDPAKQSQHLSAYDGENCCTYNLLKLAQRVFMYNADQASADYIERALYNHILGQQDPATSMVTYFTPLQTGAYRLYSTRDSSFWCCVGSGFESHVRYASYIYYHPDDALWVNLLIPSTVDWQGTRLTQVTDFPASGLTVLTVSGQSRRFTLHLRKPWWATSVTVRVNGKRVSGLNITRLWKASDKVEVSYGMALHEEATTDDPTRVALLYGPIVLGGELDSVAHPFSDPKKYNDYYTYDYQVPASLPTRCTYHRLSDVKPEGRLQWCVGDITVRPFYDIHHHRYVVYWKKQ